ncbi:hypothetical protein EDB19DRAFT_1915153 [Suillus lakei]|nr:hypothetical protein EDB19DRAFT_1915153 [Suillus lakei]
MSNIPGFTEPLSPTGDLTTFDLADMANIFEALANTTLVTLAKVRLIVTKYLMWEGEVFILPWVSFCEGLSISPPLSHNLQFFVRILGMSLVELLDYQEFYDSFMKLPVEPSGAWVRGRVVNTYPLDWWNSTFDAADYRTFTTSFPNYNKIRGDSVPGEQGPRRRGKMKNAKPTEASERTGHEMVNWIS